MISRAKKYVAVLLVFVCVCMIFSPQTAYAAEDSFMLRTVLGRICSQGRKYHTHAYKNQ